MASVKIVFDNGREEIVPYTAKDCHAMSFEGVTNDEALLSHVSCLSRRVFWKDVEYEPVLRYFRLKYGEYVNRWYVQK